MRWSDLTTTFRLARVLREPSRFQRLRRARGPFAREAEEFALRCGLRVKLRLGSRDFHVFDRVWARDDYGLARLRFDRAALVVDLGAHIGLFALRAALAGARVVCVEPAPENLALLEQHRALNGLQERLAIVPAAVGASDTSANLLRDGDPYGFRLGEGAQGLRVAAGSLESLFAAQAVERCALLKSDCEGGEYAAILESSHDVLRRCERVRFEFHAAPGRDPRELRARLESAGFRCERWRERSGGGSGLGFFVRS
jgi:FkbM family methyltransferase